MAYPKFDDPPATRANESRKLDPVFPKEAWRRALQGVLNRVVAGTAATSLIFYGTSAIASLGTGSTCGIKIGNSLMCVINGRLGTSYTQDNLYLQAGTQGSNRWVKYLVAVKHGTYGTVFAGNEGTASTKALLPDCPDGYCAVGYLEYATTSGPLLRIGAGTAGAQCRLSGAGAGTNGTVIAWVNLQHMPMDEE